MDTDFLVYALSTRGPEWRRLNALVDSDSALEMSAVAWYEFCRGPRTPEQVAVARSLFGDQGVIALTDAIAERAAEEFRRLGSPRRRAADIVIGATAVSYGATLVTRNREEFDDLEGLNLEVVP